MQKKIITVFLFFFALISACHKKVVNHSSNKNIASVQTNKGSSKIKNVNVSCIAGVPIDTAPNYTIDSMKINNDILSIFVNYSGGCKKHSFELFSNGAYGKSLPPQIYVSLQHYSNKDACRQLISEELKFNISNLKYPGQNTVIVNLGNKQRIYYVTQ